MQSPGAPAPLGHQVAFPSNSHSAPCATPPRPRSALSQWSQTNPASLWNILSRETVHTYPSAAVKIGSPAPRQQSNSAPPLLGSSQIRLLRSSAAVKFGYSAPGQQSNAAPPLLTAQIQLLRSSAAVKFSSLAPRQQSNSASRLLGSRQIRLLELLGSSQIRLLGSSCLQQDQIRLLGSSAAVKFGSSSSAVKFGSSAPQQHSNSAPRHLGSSQIRLLGSSTAVKFGSSAPQQQLNSAPRQQSNSAQTPANSSI